MRLVLAWLIGAPLLVGSMVLARAVLMPETGDAIAQAHARAPAQARAQMTELRDCQPGRGDQQDPVPAITADRAPCETLAIQ